MFNDRRINIQLELKCDEVFGVALFKVAHVRHTVEEGKIVDDCIKFEVVIFSETLDLHFPDRQTGVAAEYQN